MSARAHFTRRNPWLIIVPIIACLWGLWSGYLYLNRETSASTNNILPGGTFDVLDNNGNPLDWTIDRTGAMQYTTSVVPGTSGGSAVKLAVSDYTTGELRVASPKVHISANSTYLYKGFYKTSVPFDLLVRYYYANGTTQLRLVRSVPSQGDPWSTVSTTLRGDPAMTDVQFLYHVAGNGTLELDNTYLEKDPPHIRPPVTPTLQNNLIPDGVCDTHDAWVPFTTGENVATLSHLHENNNQFLRTDVTQYTSGEAKWQPQPHVTKTGERYRFSVDYRANAHALVIAETVLTNGQRVFTTLSSLPISTDWLHYETTYETPRNAQSTFIAVVMQHAGILDTDNYALNRIDTPGPAQFKRPLISITFDDGWQTDYQHGAQELNTFGYRGTFYINPATIDTKDIMTTAEIQNLVARGHQLASHSYEHKDLTTLNHKALSYQLLESQIYLKKITKSQTIDFASPYGKTDPDVTTYIKQYYRSHRGTEDGINTRQNFDPYNLRVMFMGASTSLKNLQEAITDAKTHNGWLILVYHSVNDTPVNTHTIAPQRFQSQLQIIQDNGIVVSTVSDALHELESQLR